MADIETVRVIIPRPEIIKVSVAVGTSAGFILPLELSGMRIKADGSFQLWNSDQSLYHTILVQGNAGEEYITIGAGEA